MNAFSWTRHASSTFLATILGETSQHKAAAQHRPRRSMRRPAIEALEDRTPLSTGISAGTETLAIATLPQFRATIVDIRVAAFYSQGAGAGRSGAFANFGGLFASRSSSVLDSQTGAAFGGTPPASGMSAAQTVTPSSNLSPMIAFRSDGFMETPGFEQGSFSGGGGPDAENPPMLYFSGSMPFYMFAQVPRPVASPTEDDTTFAGPLPLDNSTNESLAVTTNQTDADRSDMNELNVMASGRSLSTNLNVQPSTMDWTSNLGGWNSQRPLAELTDSNAAPFVLDDTSDQPEPPASITAGVAPIGFLLKGPDLPDEASPRGESQVAELVPSSESSLALTATLWTISSDSRPPAADNGRSSDRAAEPDISSDSAPHLTAYLIGLDEAVQQSSSDLREEILASDSPLAGAGRRGTARDRRVEWMGPVLPAGGERTLQNEQSGSPPAASLPGSRTPASGRSRFAVSADGPAREQNDQPQSQDARSMAIAVLPALSVSIFGAGWLWWKRPSWMRLGRRRREQNHSKRD
jgi:hypothetical protein